MDGRKKDLLNFKEVIIESIKELDEELKRELIEDFVEENAYLNFVVEQLELLKDIDE